MSNNINQVYIANPSTTATDSDLMYLGKSPYGPTNDSAIKKVDLLAQFESDIKNSLGNISLPTGFVSASASSVILTNPIQAQIFANFGSSSRTITMPVSNASNSLGVGQSIIIRSAYSSQTFNILNSDSS